MHRTPYGSMIQGAESHNVLSGTPWLQWRDRRRRPSFFVVLCSNSGYPSYTGNASNPPTCALPPPTSVSTHRARQLQRSCTCGSWRGDETSVFFTAWVQAKKGCLGSCNCWER